MDKAAAYALQRKLEEQAAWDELHRVDYWFDMLRKFTIS